MRGPHGVFFTLVHANHLHVKGGYLSIATQGSYRLSSPHPLALSTASCPGKPATAETRLRAGTEDVEHRHLAKFAGTHSKIRPRARRNPPWGRAP